MSALGLRLEDLQFSYSDAKPLFKNLNLSVAPGERVAIVGPSGCGKSTLLKLLLGTKTAESGRIQWTASPEGRMGVVFQEATLLPWQNVRQNVLLPLILSRKTRSAENVAELLKSVGLRDWEFAYPAQLSGGMKMRVALARALVSRPGVLLMDEPFSSLDEIMREKLDIDLARLLQNEKTTFFLVTHNISEAVFLCDRIWVLGGAGQGLRIDYRVSLPPKARDAQFFLDHEVVDQIRKLRSYLREDIETWGNSA